ncbi:uncharacterized protein LOC126592238 [Malus sylvestris]|uniref:uncharacterized protein LOC126592238 n=1 Tax=Malus sylvestris TaxID=3752 RepID=UPI0021ACB2C5|nr:uncharacterized protein LOC126592238 [Malus sylvestris]
MEHKLGLSCIHLVLHQALPLERFCGGFAGVHALAVEENCVWAVFFIVYVGTVIHGAQTGVVMHPLGVASSTALGAFASVVAMLFPYPRLSYYEVSKSWRMYAGNASQRLACFVEAISSRDKSGALEFLSRGQSLSKEAAKLLQSISNNLVNY